MALDRNGRVLTWGTNDYGQLGNGGTSYQKTPQHVVDLDDVEVSDVVAGGWHSIVLSKQGLSPNLDDDFWSINSREIGDQVEK